MSARVYAAEERRRAAASARASRCDAERCCKMLRDGHKTRIIARVATFYLSELLRDAYAQMRHAHYDVYAQLCERPRAHGAPKAYAQFYIYAHVRYAV